MEELVEFEEKISREEDFSEALHEVKRRALKMGVIRQGYTISPVFDRANSPRATTFSDGFSDEFVAEYLENDYRKIDPIPDYTMAKGTLVDWMEAIDASLEMRGVQRFKDILIANGFEHGFGIPLFGPNGRNAYAGFDFGVPRREIDRSTIFKLRMMSQIAHQRSCLLFERKLDVPILSQRENEVLRWMSIGKSNSDIGGILGISPETVRTYSRRIYQKLGAHDRTSATVRGLKLGILKNAGL